MSLTSPFTTPGASKKVKFQLSRNLTKFDVVARFCETIPTVVIQDVEKFRILSEITILPFFKKLEYSRVLHFPLLKKNFVSKFCTIIMNNMHMQRALYHACKLVILVLND